jgi:PPOX class probable F420-dependent enzyme
VRRDQLTKEETAVSQRLTEAAKDLLREPVLAHIATVDARGHPHITPVWIDVDGDDVVFNTAEGRVKAVNLHHNRAVAVSVADPADPYRVLALQGEAVELTHEGADEHIDSLAKKYLGVDSYPNRVDTEQRVKVRIRPERIAMQPS